MGSLRNRFFDPMQSSPVGFGGLRVVLCASIFFGYWDAVAGLAVSIVLDQLLKINGSFYVWVVMTASSEGNGCMEIGPAEDRSR